MATYKDLQDRIALDYLNRMTLSNEVKRAIQNSIKTYEATRYWFNEASTATATTAAVSFINIPSDFLTLDRLEVTIASADYELSRRDFNWIRDMNVTRDQNQPTDFAYHGDRFELAAIPDSAYSVTCYYIRTLPVLSADADTNAWTNEAANLIAHAATIDLLSGILQADERVINRHVGMLRMAQNELNLRNSTRLAFKLKATNF